MTQHSIIAQQPESTVVAEYRPVEGRERGHQTEAQLEAAFIAQLREQGYEYLPVKDEAALVDNLRRQMDRLNGCRLTDDEWHRFFSSLVANPNDGPVEKTRTLQTDHVKTLATSDGGFRNLKLIDKENIHRNALQVINQYATADGTHPNRYDVTILVNGLPMVHVELKRRGVDLKEAFNQIERYQRESFWAGSGLFEYVQLFVISNGTLTKYYSNTTRAAHVRQSRQLKARGKTASTGSYEFTSCWADERNTPIRDLVDFTATFFARHTLLALLTRFCVFTADDELLVMRPYQIAATERILQRIRIASNDRRRLGTTAAGGYVWHTTGSGKTLTSFKTAQLASRMDEVDKVLFVVDRKDLDYQTMREYDRFEPGAADSNADTATLQRQLADPQCRIIITTIQKLSRFVARNRTHPVYDAHVVMIFDECHRSQFNEMHEAIARAFRRYHMFGFTGTPIFAANASAAGLPNLKTTAQAFGDRLHSYTIVNAIADGNVLPFRIDYVKTTRQRDAVDDKAVWGIDTEAALLAPERIEGVVRYLLDHFDQKTKRTSSYKLHDRRVTGFNSILATASIPAAVRYYTELQRQLAARPADQRLKVAMIYSYAPNGGALDPDGAMGEECPDATDGLDATAREALDRAIADYNALFHTAFDTSGERFQGYYKDLSRRMKERDLDLLIVVNMFLTGFDAKTLNTLWVDKNLRMHGLLQAFSRTNRKLDSVKTFGNIVCFRNLEEATNESLALFGDEQAGGVVLLRPFADYYDGYDAADGRHHAGYAEIVARLQADFPVGQPVVGEQRQRDFVRLFGDLLRAVNILQCFDDFRGRELLGERDMQDYQSLYLDLYHKRPRRDKENINDDLVFEIELVKQVEVGIDYILALIALHHDGHSLDAEVRLAIGRAVDSSLELRNKKDLIEDFVNALTPADTDVEAVWHDYIRRRMQDELRALVADEGLRPDATGRFVAAALRDGSVRENGTDLADLLPPMSRFDRGRAAKKERVLARLRDFFDRYADLGVSLTATPASPALNPLAPALNPLAPAPSPAPAASPAPATIPYDDPHTDTLPRAAERD